MVSRLYLVVLSALAFLGAFPSQPATLGQETPGSESGEANPGTLQVGDKAPRIQVDHWLGGEAVEAFSKDKVYVIEFWATWCGPCINAMPHLSELAEQYSKDGLVVVAMTRLDKNNTREAVEEFVKGPGEKYRFRFALCEGEATHRDYMEASGQKGIPCSFVIDREGNVAYIGHPHDLDYVLSRVMKGEWRGKVDADELREMNDSILKLGQMAQTDPGKALQITEHIRSVNPQRAKNLDFAYVEAMVLCHNKMFDKAKSNIESLAEGADKGATWGSVGMLCGLLASKDMNPDGTHREFALQKLTAAEEALKDDWQNLVQVAVGYQMAGDLEKYKACMGRVVELCPDEQLKKAIQMAISALEQAAEK